MKMFVYKQIGFFSLVSNLWKNRELIIQMTLRDVIGRYQGSFLGLLWSFLNPVLMLCVYTFFFSVVFKARWLGGSGSKAEFALILFSGLIIFNFFAECLNRAPSLMQSNVNFIKKIIFPLEILPVVTMLSALFHLLVSLCVWICFYVVIFGMPHIEILLFPIVILPLLFIILGITWMLSSLGVYLRDVSQVVGTVVSILMFLSPIFYPIESLPELFQGVVRLSPVTLAVEQARSVMYWGNGIDWVLWGYYMMISVCISWLGYMWFQKTRKGFADVI